MHWSVGLSRIASDKGLNKNPRSGSPAAGFSSARTINLDVSARGGMLELDHFLMPRNHLDGNVRSARIAAARSAGEGIREAVAGLGPRVGENAIGVNGERTEIARHLGRSCLWNGKRRALERDFTEIAAGVALAAVQHRAGYGGAIEEDYSRAIGRPVLTKAGV